MQKYGHRAAGLLTLLGAIFALLNLNLWDSHILVGNLLAISPHETVVNRYIFSLVMVGIISFTELCLVRIIVNFKCT